MLSYPMKFKVYSEAESGIQKVWSTRSEQYTAKVDVAIPPEFAGPGGGYSPEDLYAMALTNCFIATFKVFAEKSRLSFNHIKISAELTVDRNDKGQPWMSKIHLLITISGVTQKENAQRLLEKTSQSCMILNSVLTEKIFSYQIAE